MTEYRDIVGPSTLRSGTDIKQYATLAERPAASDFGVGVCYVVETDSIYSSNNVSWAAISGLSYLASFARMPDLIISGGITRDSNGAAISASVIWPDGATGTYTATTINTSFPGAIDSYTITHDLDGGTKTYTQPLVTRNASGAITNIPSITVS